MLCIVFKQAFVVAGGQNSEGYKSTVMILPPGASAWSFLASLPWPLAFATASVVGRGFRVAGGGDGASYKSEVTLLPFHQTKAEEKLQLSIINTENIARIANAVQVTI